MVSKALFNEGAAVRVRFALCRGSSGPASRRGAAPEDLTSVTNSVQQQMQQISQLEAKEGNTREKKQDITWWLIPVSISPVISELTESTLLIPFITRAI